MINWHPLLAILSEKKRILISTHARPDGDALGSEIALCLALRARGHNALIVNSDPLPTCFDFIEEERYLFRILNVDFLPEELQKIDLAIIVDTSAKAQLPKIYDALKEQNIPLAVIDHHSVSDTLTADTFRDENAPATGAILMDFFESANIPITQKMAEYLFIAISTDTGWFRFPSMQPKTFRQAAKLMEMGVLPGKIYRCVNESYPFSRFKLIGVFAQNATLDSDSRLIYSWLTAEDFKKYGANYNETTDLVNLLLSTKGTEVAVAFIEHDNGVRINFRSRSEINVAEIAKIFGGGGHVKASGAFMEKSIKEVILSVLDEVRTFMVK
ncbi:MAG: bifunctional oligoribonuclease/PAP phosphatase NrnA [Planctomycetia bacterium]|nr:bifunctional oligoribonuclease/PAP phosphatase NrnA [Planctomycetia bacterium]